MTIEEMDKEIGVLTVDKLAYDKEEKQRIQAATTAKVMMQKSLITLKTRLT